jgi:hypothetical protein
MVKHKVNHRSGKRKTLTTRDLQFLLAGAVIKLDCGHRCTVGHNFSNTMIIHSEGGGTIRTECHNCGY